jgi:hypothetical protein
VALPKPSGTAVNRKWSVMLILALALLIAVSCTSQLDETINPSRHNSTYTDPKLGWSWNYPANWHVQRFSGRIGDLGFLEGNLVTNVAHDFHHPDCGNGCGDSGWDLHGTPGDLVIVEFHCLEAGVQMVHSPKRDTRFPLSLAELKQSSVQNGYGEPERYLFKRVRVQGDERFYAMVWLGRKVNAKERATASRIVSSITKPTEPCP